MITLYVLPEAAGGVLHRIEPADGAPHRRVVGRDVAGLEGGERGARPVEVVDAPTAPPGAVALLLALEVREPALERGLVAGCGGEGLECMSADVHGRRGDHGTAVAERDLRGQGLRVSGVEGAPAAVARLHPRDPVQRAADGGVADPKLAERER